jgi:hypothetical protein
MAKNSISARQQAVLSCCWVINKDERDTLDKFFLVNETWANIEPDLRASEDHVCMFLEQEGTEYEVVFMSPLPKLRAAALLGLSFRQNYRSNFACVLIKEWHAVEQVQVQDRPAAEEPSAEL